MSKKSLDTSTHWSVTSMVGRATLQSTKLSRRAVFACLDERGASRDPQKRLIKRKWWVEQDSNLQSPLDALCFAHTDCGRECSSEQAGSSKRGRWKEKKINGKKRDREKALRKENIGKRPADFLWHDSFIYMANHRKKTCWFSFHYLNNTTYANNDHSIL